MNSSKLSQLSEKDATTAARMLSEQRRRRQEAALARLEQLRMQETSAEETSVEEGKKEAHGEQQLELCQHRLYCAADMPRALKLATVQDTRTALADLQQMGSIRPLAPVPNDYLERCQALQEEFPHFSTVIYEKILPELAIGSFAGTGLKLPSLCIQGEPGVGKTFFASRIAEVFCLPFTRINLEGAQGNFSITGLDKSYSNHNPGEIVRFLARKTDNAYANGIIALEEIDKTGGDARYSVENSLIQILEDNTARTFRDLSIPELQLNITSLNFIFTANKISTVSPPVLSRLQPVELPSLTREQAGRIAVNQFTKLIAELKLSEARLTLTEQSKCALSEISPRQQKAVLRSAIGTAIHMRRTEVIVPTATDFPSKRVSIGFF
jgi:ATP-dependent Lon protease